MNDELNKYKVDPGNFWKGLLMSGGDGYDDMELAEKHGWHAIPAWGKDGWNLGSWPLVIVFHRNLKKGDETAYQVIEYVEGDVTMWSCPTAEIRQQVTDELAFFHWKFSHQEWVKEYNSVDELPDELRGSYGRQREQGKEV
jgi:hypothetical protein